ncbi:MAG: HD domain-containing protein [Lachnospiraceae bacterium]|nr:HD domain-containing protein [Lachnospiraceae bacterium]
MQFVGELQEGANISGIYLCKNKQNLKTKAGKSYYSMILQDKTGTIDAKVWELNNGIEHFESMDFIKVDGMVTSFLGSLQVNVRRVRRTQEQEYNIQDYLPTSQFPIDGMMEELTGYIESIENPYLKALLESFFVEDAAFIKSFKEHSAAKSVHHGFVGGLLEHTLGVTKLCDFYCTRYPVLNRDLLLCAAMCHDIGKTEELSLFPANDYTDEGQLIGHIVGGTEMIHDHIKEIPNFPVGLANELKHCILAHHGELEYGSPKKPALVEALALNLADNTDAKMETMTELFASAADGLEWMGYNRMFESNLRRTSK